MRESQLTAILPYFGGKRTLAPQIVERLGPHNMYIEPFCGSLAVLFAKEPSANETVSDLHGDVVNLAMVLASDRWIELYRKVDRYLASEAIVEAFRLSLADDCPPARDPAWITRADVDRAARFLALSWISRNGTAGSARCNYQMAVRWSQGGGSPGIRWRSAVASVPAWHDRLKGVLILRRNAFEILPKLRDEKGLAIYCDPPYLKATRGSGGSSAYEYDFDETPADLFGAVDQHERLAIELRRFKRARVVVSYYDHPRLEELYVRHGFSLERIPSRKLLANANARDHRPEATEAPEVLLVNDKGDGL